MVQISTMDHNTFQHATFLCKEAVINIHRDIPFFLASFFAFFDNALGFPILATIPGTMLSNTTVWYQYYNTINIFY